MDFRTELAKWGYNKGNSVDVEILIDEILPSLFSQQERSYSEEDMKKAIQETITLMRYRATEFREHENTVIEQFKKK